MHDVIVNGKHLCGTAALFQDDTINRKTRKYMCNSDDKIFGEFFFLSGQTVKLIRRRSGSSANIHLRANHHMEEVGGWNLSPYEEDDHAKEKLKQATGIHCNSCTIYLGISHGPKSRQ